MKKPVFCRIARGVDDRPPAAPTAASPAPPAAVAHVPTQPKLVQPAQRLQSVCSLFANSCASDDA